MFSSWQWNLPPVQMLELGVLFWSGWLLRIWFSERKYGPKLKTCKCFIWWNCSTVSFWNCKLVNGHICGSCWKLTFSHCEGTNCIIKKIGRLYIAIAYSGEKLYIPQLQKSKNLRERISKNWQIKTLKRSENPRKKLKSGKTYWRNRERIWEDIEKKWSHQFGLSYFWWQPTF